MSENEQVTEGQNENAGEDAAAAELPVGDLNAGAGSDEPKPDPSLENDPPPAGSNDDKLAELEKRAEDAGDPEDSKTAPAEDVVTDAGPDTVTDEEQGDEEEVISDETLPPGGPRASTDNLPTYKCHKLVRAFKIAAAESLSGGRVKLVGVDADHFVIVLAAYVDQHHPKIGGYYVRYHDGYQSWSPAAAFEDGYNLVD